MIFIWTRWGILVVLYGLAGMLVGGIVGNAAGLGSRQLITIGICEVLAAIALWFTGVRLNRGTGADSLIQRRGRVSSFGGATLSSGSRCSTGLRCSR